ncbi:hypothetical protein AAEX28_01740 [Lentisphaerota bacterium WC36G]|nr:hypothetical protein LJT99_04625 [Lentisphaerae bacterium WC36]
MNKIVDIFIPLDARESACNVVWPVAEQQLKQLVEVIQQLGWQVNILHEKVIRRVVDGIKVMENAQGSRLITFLAGWTYPDFVVSPLSHISEDIPKLLLGSIIPDFPGAVGLLAAAGGLEQLNIKFSRMYVEYFDKKETYQKELSEFLETGEIKFNQKKFIDIEITSEDRARAQNAAKSLKGQIYGCIGPRSMEMWNKISEEDFLKVFGVSKLSFDQLRLVKMAEQISDEQALQAFEFLKEKKLDFKLGDDPDKFLTDEMVIFQLKMYYALLNLKEEFGLDFLGVQDQLDLITWYPGTDLILGLLNNRLRPSSDGETVVAATEADDGAAITMQVLKLIQDGGEPVGFNDLRYWNKDKNLYYLVNSGALAPYFANKSHESLEGCWSERQTPMYFAAGGGTCSVVCRVPGVMTWARFSYRDGKIYLCAGRGVTNVPTHEQWLERTERCSRDWPQWYVALCSHMEYYINSNHPMTVVGDYLGALKAFAEELNIEFECYDYCNVEDLTI